MYVHRLKGGGKGRRTPTVPATDSVRLVVHKAAVEGMNKTSRTSTCSSAGKKILMTDIEQRIDRYTSSHCYCRPVGGPEGVHAEPH